MSNKLLAIQGASIESIDKWNANKRALKLSSTKYLDHILNNVTEVDHSELNKLKEQVKSLISEIDRLNNTKTELPFPQFVFDPSAVAKKINRAIALERKKGNLKGMPQDRYLQNFTLAAVKYFLKNEYTEI